jgi:hypothetical protein
VNRRRWFFVLLLGAAIGTVLYSVGVPYPIVYIVRGIATHFAYSYHGGH